MNVKKRGPIAVLAAVLAALITLGTLPLAGLFREERPRATLSATETEHGCVYLGDGGSVLNIAKGDTVTVTAMPDEGYYADSLAVFGKDGSGRTVPLQGNTASLSVTEDMTVTAVFQKAGSVGLAAVSPAEITPGKAVLGAEEYVARHADPALTGKVGTPVFADMPKVTLTLVNGELLPGATLKSLWNDADSDGIAENYTALLSQAVCYVALYDVNPGSEYYVGWAGPDIDGARLTDWGAAEDSTAGVLRDGFQVDGGTGLVYVPKKYTDFSDKENPVAMSSRIQLVYTARDSSARAGFDFVSDKKKLRVSVPDGGRVSAPVIATSTKIRLAASGKARRGVTGRTIDSVTLNGIRYDKSDDMWKYDPETGVLEIFLPPSGVHGLSVEMSGGFRKTAMNLLDRLLSVFGVTASAADLNVIGTWKFSDTPTVGMNAVLSTRNY